MLWCRLRTLWPARRDRLPCLLRSTGVAQGYTRTGGATSFTAPNSLESLCRVRSVASAATAHASLRKTRGSHSPRSRLRLGRRDNAQVEAVAFPPVLKTTFSCGKNRCRPSLSRAFRALKPSVGRMHHGTGQHADPTKLTPNSGFARRARRIS